MSDAQAALQVDQVSDDADEEKAPGSSSRGPGREVGTEASSDAGVSAPHACGAVNVPPERGGLVSAVERPNTRSQGYKAPEKTLEELERDERERKLEARCLAAEHQALAEVGKRQAAEEAARVAAAQRDEEAQAAAAARARELEAAAEAQAAAAARAQERESASAMGKRWDSGGGSSRKRPRFISVHPTGPPRNPPRVLSPPPRRRAESRVRADGLATTPLSPALLWKDAQPSPPDEDGADTLDANRSAAQLKGEITELEARVAELKAQEGELLDCVLSLHQRGFDNAELDRRLKEVHEQRRELEQERHRLRLMSTQMEVQYYQLKNSVRSSRSAPAVARLAAREAEDFKGQSNPPDIVIHFLRGVVSVCQENGTPEAEHMRLMTVRHLKGAAKSWYERMVDHEPELVASWEGLREALIDQYCGAHGVASLRRAFEQIRQGDKEELEDYTVRLEGLARIIGVDVNGEDTSRRYYNGLRMMYQERAYDQYAAGRSTHDLHEYLQRWERHRAEQRSLGRRPAPVASSVPPMELPRSTQLWSGPAGKVTYASMEAGGYGAGAGAEEEAPVGAILWQDCPSASQLVMQDAYQLTEINAREAGLHMMEAIHDPDVLPVLALWSSKPDLNKPGGTPLFKASFTCHRCGEGGHFAKSCTQAKECYVCGDKGHQRKACPESIAANGSPRCNYCQLQGHVESGCFRKKRKGPPVVALSKHEAGRQQAAARDLANQVALAALPKTSGGSSAPPTVAAFFAAFHAAMKQLTEEERKRFIITFMTGFQQDAARLEDFQKRA